MQVWIGVDLGTTHAKTLVATATGAVLMETQRHYPAQTTLTAAGKSEQVPEALFQTALHLLRDTLAALPLGAVVASISFSAAWHGLMAINRAGEVILPLLTWADARSHLEATRLQAQPFADSLLAETGTPFHPMSPLCKLLWLQENQPDIFAQAYKFISLKEYLFFRLFGRLVVDTGIASATGLWDGQNERWSEQALSVVQISADQLSEPLPCTHFETALKPEWKAYLGLKSEVPFVLGGGDGALANLGSGVLAADLAALTVGTSGAVRRSVPRTAASLPKGLFRYTLAGHWDVLGGAINNGGIALTWAAAALGLPDTSPRQLLAWADASVAGAKGLIFLPYLLGERAPIWDAQAKGAFIGLSFQHQKSDLARAVLEGITFALLSILQKVEAGGAPIAVLSVSGAITRSPLWLQVLADASGKQVQVPHISDASAFGAAILGMYATGAIPHLEAAQAMVSITQTFFPNPSLLETYQKNLAVYQSLYPLLKPSFSALA